MNINETNYLIDAIKNDSEQWMVVDKLKPGKTIELDRHSRFKIVDESDPKVETVSEKLQGLNENTLIHVRQLKVAVLTETDPVIKKLGLVALENLNVQMKTSYIKLKELADQKLKNGSSAHQTIKERLEGIRAVMEYITANEIAPSIKEIRAKLHPHQSRLPGSPFAVLRTNRTELLLKQFLVKPPESAFHDIPEIKRHTTDSTSESSKQVNDLINGVDNDIHPVDLIGKGSPKVPYQFQRDIKRTSLLKLNGEVIAQTNVSKDEDIVRCYQKMCQALGNDTAGFRLASFLVQSSFVDLTLTTKPFFHERGLSISAITGMYNEVEVTDEFVFITIKGCFTGKDPEEINLNPGVFLVKRMIAIPLSELQKNSSPNQPLVLNDIKGANFISDPIVSKQVAKSLLESF